MGTGNSQKITLHQGNLAACGNGREEFFRRCMLSWIFKGSVSGSPDAALGTAGKNSTQLHQRLSRGAAMCPKYPHQPCVEAGQGPGVAQQPLAAFLSHPQPLPPQPSALTQESFCWELYQVKLQLCASCSHPAFAFLGHGRGLFSPPLCAVRGQRVN